MRDRFIGQILKGVSVLDRSGDKVGTVERAYRYAPVSVHAGGGSAEPSHDEIVEVRTGFLGLGKRLFIPLGAIDEVNNGNVFLAKSAVEIDKLPDWHERPPFLDQLE